MTTSAPSKEVVIDVQNISRHFGDLIAVQDVSFPVEKAAIFGLLGPNGSGKSTLIRMLLGILEPTSGTAIVGGHDVRSEAEAIKRQIGYMSQHFTLYNDLSVHENIQFYGRIYGLRGQPLKDRYDAVLELTSLADRIHQLGGELSGGWKRRLALACALIHEPSLLFLDEPTAGIDPVARRELWDLLFELSANGVTLLVTTHYMDEAERCSDVGYIYLSRLLAVGKPKQLKLLPQVTPDGTKRLELLVPNGAQQMMRLRTMPYVHDATLFGEHLHLLVDASTENDSLISDLSIPSDQATVREIAPSLEDVFVTLTQQAERAADEVELAHGKATVSDSQATVSRSSDTAMAPTVPATAPVDEREPKPSATSHKAKPKSKKMPDATTTRPPQKRRGGTWRGLGAMLSKEFIHIRRQPVTIFFTLVVPAMQTIIFGYAINTQIERIPMVVQNLDGRQKSRELIESFRNTRRFQIEDIAYSDDTFMRSIVSGRTKAGLRIPPDYSDKLLRGEQVQVQVLIDGSDSQVASTALNSASLIGLNQSLQRGRNLAATLQIAPARDPFGHFSLPIDVRPRLLFNPDLRTEYFFVPALVGIIMQLVTLFLTAFAIVRERERGT
ncbi:MAG: ABC transporter ATP-binding protein/permease, partial [Planctomycetales bacterium]|nr:ABC transporter ATP-binding protein/permease [Planctomycetales bacterium]